MSRRFSQQDAWCLAVCGSTRTGATAVTLSARRFTIEESFRDTKDPRLALPPRLSLLREGIAQGRTYKSAAAPYLRGLDLTTQDP